MHRKHFISLFACLLTLLPAFTVVLATPSETFARKKAPALIIRDTGGIVGPDLEFIVWTAASELPWNYHSRNATPKGKKSGNMTSKQLAAFISALKKAGLTKVKSIRPSPAPHSSIIVNFKGAKHAAHLPRDHELIKLARKYVTDIAKKAK